MASTLSCPVYDHPSENCTASVERPEQLSFTNNLLRIRATRF